MLARPLPGNYPIDSGAYTGATAGFVFEAGGGGAARCAPTGGVGCWLLPGWTLASSLGDRLNKFSLKDRLNKFNLKDRLNEDIQLARLCSPGLFGRSEAVFKFLLDYFINPEL
jgi:hypothetical protein